jgi:hypothetical protein
MSEKPQQRLVGKWDYVQTTGKKIGLYSMAVFLVCAGVMEALEMNWHNGVMSIIFGVAVIILAVWCCKHFVVTAKKIEPIRLHTKRATDLLAPEESLIRASDRPPSQQQAELLRAAGQGAETPAEELLRAGQESGRDV